VGREPKRASFRPRIGGYINIACTGTLTKTHRVFNASSCGFIFYSKKTLIRTALPQTRRLGAWGVVAPCKRGEGWGLGERINVAAYDQNVLARREQPSGAAVGEEEKNCIIENGPSATHNRSLRAFTAMASMPNSHAARDVFGCVAVQNARGVIGDRAHRAHRDHTGRVDLPHDRQRNGVKGKIQVRCLLVCVRWGDGAHPFAGRGRRRRKRGCAYI
jgi:hypothetical protein